MSRPKYLRDIQALAAKAMASNGERIGTSEFRWNLAGDCENPYSTMYHGRPSGAPLGPVRRLNGAGYQYPTAKYVTVGPRTQWPIWVDVLTRCRLCRSCINAKSNIWRHRIGAELSQSPRTWFGTFTLRPSAHYHFLMMARQKEGAQGVDYDALGERERLKVIDKLIGNELSLWLKRLREAYRIGGGRLRHIIICEQHKSGLPHYHALIHQCMIEPSLTHRMLETQVSNGNIVQRWPYGFTQWRLVKSAEEAAGYATKAARYASKSVAARVRASQHYGLPTSSRPSVENNVYATTHLQNE